ncbi:MAG: Sodium/calcium exchanger protein-domain-containing protein [Lentinula lateritia]|uniref:Sodium/calcium exchanger protein-domain-containing protein n=1 Tax=Lentinula lateritia TaxID=40482 RepID=A0ABQ8VWB9_9AGAR|nr:MAG: Sodium/calcium exchanger protein-domain-containing protein [Lentinula lateritia]KAJ4500678.1 Sodium/calcium exchanger protein-domain-containing protein [Lentinula lateritia]
MAGHSFKLAFAVLFLLQCFLWSRGRYGQFQADFQNPGSGSSLVKRYLEEFSGLSEERQCRPLAFSTDQQCAHVSEFCAGSRTFLSFQYLRYYFCTEVALRPSIFVGLIIWLIFLFSTLGISASDFFTPNLATIAQLLGLDENVAGVTFLAFGNGSPDVFSTFSAMRADSGSLAIGELIGAASFIVSCVVGSICIIKPFHVNPRPFLRDVGFFAVAVGLLLIILRDGLIHPWEAAMMIVLYVTYVATVIIGTWWDRRLQQRREHEAIVRAEYRDDELSVPTIFDVPYRDDSSPENNTLPVPSNPNRMRAQSSPGPPRIQTDVPRRSHSRTPSPTPGSHSPMPHFSQMPSFSLVGALEFRQVVASLRNEASSSSLNIFDSPVTPYAGGHYHSRPRSRPRTPATHDHDRDPWDAALALDERSPHVHVIPAPSDSHPGSPDLNSSSYFDDPPTSISSSIPTISHTPASPTGTESDAEYPHLPLSKWQRSKHTFGACYHTLFPTLHRFRSQSVLGQIASIFAAPAVMLLTLTLPVVVTPYISTHHAREKLDNSHNLIDFEEEGIERVLIAEEEVEDEMHGVGFNKWLTSVQVLLGPLFCIAVLFSGHAEQGWLFLAIAIAGIGLAASVIVFVDRGDNMAFKMARCFMGFFVAIVWIMAIADEVVQVLQTFGFIFGLSDAIIGLTIFAVGNSLADLVANMSIAVFAPIMGFSACFGGPMLNILLGVGISGSYIISQTSEPYKLHFGSTLLVSTVGLLILLAITIIVVPFNGYFLTRTWGIFLIACYVTLMTINVVVELRH